MLIHLLIESQLITVFWLHHDLEHGHEIARVTTHGTSRQERISLVASTWKLAGIAYDAWNKTTDKF